MLNNKHYIRHELRNPDNEMEQNNVEILVEDEDDDKLCDDFRNMTKSTSANVKRFKSTPTLRKKTAKEAKQTGNILRKLIRRITEMIPEVQQGKIRKSNTKYKIKDTNKKEEPTNEEECLDCSPGGILGGG